MMLRWMCALLVLGWMGTLVACGPSFGGSCSFPKRGECQSFDQGFSVNEVKSACDATKANDPTLEVVYSATAACPTADLIGVCRSQKSPTQVVSIHYYKVAGGYQTSEDVRDKCTGTFEPKGE